MTFDFLIKSAAFSALLFSLSAAAPLSRAEDAPAPSRFTAEHVFDLEFADDPQISPDGQTVVYVRRSMDRINDAIHDDLWTLDVRSGAHRPLIAGGAPANRPRWSPDGTRLLYNTKNEGQSELRLHFMDTDKSVSLGNFAAKPNDAVWSRDGKHIAFRMFTPSDAPKFATAPKAPKGAKWPEPMRIFDDVTFRSDGAGYLSEGANHIYLIPAGGGSPRQVTFGEVDYTAPAWRDDKTLLVVGNQAKDRDFDPIESEIYALDLGTLTLRALTTRDGPDHSPSVSPDGRKIAFLGYDDKVLSYQASHLYVMDADGGNIQHISQGHDRSVSRFAWRGDSRALITQVENKGAIELRSFSLNGGAPKILAAGLGGTSFGRPYASASFSLSASSRPSFAYTTGDANSPADITVKSFSGTPKRLTALNDDLLPFLKMATIEEITVPSRFDGKEIQAWIAFPPDFKADGSDPMILEIHGGPYTMYGPFFSAEIQRYAAEGYVTVYVNPRGSTGYGEDFSLLIDKNYPGEDYDDLETITDYLIEKNYVDPNRLFVTGGSGGGVLTSWIIGKTSRYAAAATIKPVINWLSMALTADIGPYVKRHWIRENPWENPEAYWERSPLSLVGNVTTPTLVMVGEEDHRTPTWEAEQYYGALKLKGVETALIRVPEASHYIAKRPSRLIAKTDNIMGWFKKFDPEK
jgi:acylaminoacyl-peptidase